MGKPTMWFSNKSDTNQPVQAQKQARALKVKLYKEEKLYYLGYCEADLCLYFRICRLLVFL